MLEIENFEKETKGICLLRCTSIVFTKTSFFIRWEINQFKRKVTEKNIVTSEYMIFDLEEDNIPLEKEEDSDAENLENIVKDIHLF